MSRLHTTAVTPQRAVEGGRITLHGSGFPADEPPAVTIGDHAARVAFASSTRLVVVMPSGLDSGPAPLRVDEASAEIMIAVGGDPLRNNAYVFAHNGFLGYPVGKKIDLPQDWNRKLSAARII